MENYIILGHNKLLYFYHNNLFFDKTRKVNKHCNKQHIKKSVRSADSVCVVGSSMATDTAGSSRSKEFFLVFDRRVINNDRKIKKKFLDT